MTRTRLRSHSIRTSSTLESDSGADSDSDSDVIVVDPPLAFPSKTRTRTLDRSTARSTQPRAGSGFSLSSSPLNLAQPTLAAFSLSASKRSRTTSSSASSSTTASAKSSGTLALNVSTTTTTGGGQTRKRTAPPSSLPIGVPRPPTKKRARTSSDRSQRRQTTPTELLLQLEPSALNDSTIQRTSMATQWPMAEGFCRRRSQKPKQEEEEGKEGQAVVVPSIDSDRSATPTQTGTTPRPNAFGVDLPPPLSPTRLADRVTAPKWRSTTPEMDPPLLPRVPCSIGLAVVPASRFKSGGARTAPRKHAHSPLPPTPTPPTLPSLPVRPESPLPLVTKTASAVSRRKKRCREETTSLAPSQRRIRVDPPSWARSHQLSLAPPSTHPSRRKSKSSKGGHSRSPSLSSSPPPPPPPQQQPMMTTTALVSELRMTDFASLDPQRRYGFESSLLFRIEHVSLGALTYQQGGRGKIVNTRITGVGGVPDAKVQREEAVVPSWARTEDGTEWEEDVLRRLGAQLAALATPLSSSSSSSDASFVARIFGADLGRMKQVRLGRAGGLECYVVGRETPCRHVEMMGWIVDREYRERDNEHVYAGESSSRSLSLFVSTSSWLRLMNCMFHCLSVDDGTGIVSVHCAAPSSVAAGTTGGPRQPFLPPHDPSSSSTSSTVATLQQRQREAQRLAISRQFAPLEEEAERRSDRTVLPKGRLVRVVGKVEEARSLRDPGRRIVASLVGEFGSIDRARGRVFGIGAGVRVELTW